MPFIEYTPRSFTASSREIIDRAVTVLLEYDAQGFDLTLRQLYYQFVARGWLPNSDRAYHRLGSIVNDARLAGEIDWDHIVDRTRYVREETFWKSPAEIVEAAAQGFRLDKWADQPTYVEVWVEKDALIGVIEQACKPLEAAYLSCRGYVSQSEMWRAAQRLGGRIDLGQEAVILHLGDHDPSGIDMSRDIEDRIRSFLWGDGRDAEMFELQRIALNWEQIEEYSPPPNPAKVTDSRASSYIIHFGRESWELDALEPNVLSNLITQEILSLRDQERWAEIERQEQKEGRVLTACHERWEEVATYLDGRPE